LHKKGCLFRQPLFFSSRRDGFGAHFIPLHLKTLTKSLAIPSYLWFNILYTHIPGSANGGKKLVHYQRTNIKEDTEKLQ
ncbi:MAG TPA: hypothetical protein PLC81_04555, partial [Bacteroidales bacterium]|nr:hypothetical protein [Bacteroidales bacterium]